MQHSQTCFHIAEQVRLTTGNGFKLTSAQAISGGDINTAYCLQGNGLRYFAKLNRPHLLPMFAAEHDGLQELANTQTLRVPTPILFGATDSHAFLVMEFITWGASSRISSRLLGEQLAQLHRLKQPYFGWHRDNTIGSTPQINSQSPDWPSFWRDQRLGPQLKLAYNNGHTGRLQSLGEQLCAKLHCFFENYAPPPSLLHGDLWGGNSAVDLQGLPVIFDPACYYGDREADLAMTELFGGFDQHFYAAYQATWPLDAGYGTRKILYNLYHILNHLNLFGGGYGRQAEQMLDRLLAHIK